MNYTKIAVAVFFLTHYSMLCLAQNDASKNVAFVNDIAITHTELSVLEKSRSRHPMGQSTASDLTTSEQRTKLVDDLILAELLVQAARKNGIDKRPTMIAEASIQYKTLLGQMFLRDEVANMFVSEQEIRARYDAIPPKYKYSLSAIDFNTKQEAIQAAKNITSKTEFNNIADRFSVGNKKNSAWLGWIQSSQLSGPELDIVERMSEGEISSEPVKIREGWRMFFLAPILNKEN